MNVMEKEREEGKGERQGIKHTYTQREREKERDKIRESSFTNREYKCHMSLYFARKSECMTKFPNKKVATFKMNFFPRMIFNVNSLILICFKKINEC